MAQLNFGGVIENVMTREEFPLEKAREILKDETIAVIGYGVQGPGQACNLRDNGFNVIVGQRPGKTYEKAVADGWVPGETLFGIEEACQKGTIIMCLLSDAAVMSVWPTIKPYLTPGKALYFSHGFAITWNDRTGVVPPKDIDVIMVAPKGSGTSLRTMFLEGRGLNSSYAVYQDATGKAFDKTIALGIGIGDELVILQQLGYGDGDEFIEIVKIVVKRSAIALGGAGHLANRQLEDAVVLDELPKRLDDTGARIGRIGVLTRSRHAPHRTSAPWRS